MKISEAFKLRLEYYLETNKMSRHKFIKDSAIPYSTIVNLLKGNSKSPTLATLYQITDALDISVIEFLDCDLFRNINIDVD